MIPDAVFHILAQDGASAGTRDSAVEAAGAAATALSSNLGGRIYAAFRSLIEKLDILNRPDELIEMLSQVHVTVAGALLIVGILCVLNGYRWHRWVVIVCAFLSGFGLGWLMSRHLEQPYIVAGALALMAAVVANPLLKFAVAIFGGLTGAFIGANLWTAFGYQEQAHWAGALLGLTIVGMASFMMFKHVVVLFTSIGGSAMAMAGGIALLLYVPDIRDGVTSALTNNTLILPLLLTVAAVIGFTLQQGQSAAGSDDHHHRHAPEAHG
ncbi:MAG: hypothetical protein ACR2GY_10715 [Phycisphaerales bacterium]